MIRLFFYIFLFFSLNFKVLALEVTLTQGSVKPSPIAITNFFSNENKGTKIGKNISTVISDNLERSGLFIPIDKKTFIQDNKSLSKQSRFEEGKVIKSQYLLSGKVRFNAYKKKKKIIIDFKLYDVFSQKELLSLNFNPSSENSWRRISHYISDLVFEKITGETGYFDSRIVYVSEAGNKQNREKRLAIMDQDGANHKFLTNGDFLVLTPRFSPSSQKITYMSYVNRNSPRVYIFHIETGQQEIVGEFPGMTFAPRFSPDGKKLPCLTLIQKLEILKSIYWIYQLEYQNV